MHDILHTRMRQRLFVLMGVSGSGKSSIGTSVAEKIGATYMDGDEFHPQSNIDKMSRGEPLTDDDRWPWLKKVATELAAKDGTVLVGCSSLRKAYRNVIRKIAVEPVQFIYLCGSREIIAERIASRGDHFMPSSLLDSQFATLQVPDDSENAIFVDISKAREDMVTRISEAVEGISKSEIR